MKLCCCFVLCCQYYITTQFCFHVASWIGIISDFSLGSYGYVVLTHIVGYIQQLQNETITSVDVGVINSQLDVLNFLDRYNLF